VPIGQVCIREVLVAERDTSVQEAARLMRQHHVGDLVVVDARNGHRVPVGIVTDRDIVISVVAPKLDPAVFTLGDLVVRKLVTIPADLGISETIQEMRKNGVRRAPVVDKQGQLVGIVTVDDLVQLLGAELSGLGKLISREQVVETKNKR